MLLPDRVFVEDFFCHHFGHIVNMQLVILRHGPVGGATAFVGKAVVLRDGFVEFSYTIDQSHIFKDFAGTKCQPGSQAREGWMR